jgi:hypothetical protein
MQQQSNQNFDENFIPQENTNNNNFNSNNHNINDPDYPNINDLQVNNPQFSSQVQPVQDGEPPKYFGFFGPDLKKNN